MFLYKVIGKNVEGTFSEVLKAQNIQTGNFHAIKCMKQKYDDIEQVCVLLLQLSSHRLKQVATTAFFSTSTTTQHDKPTVASTLHQVNNLREIQALRRLSPHPNIITLTEVLFDQPTGRLALVFELMDANLYDIIRGKIIRLTD